MKTRFRPVIKKELRQISRDIRSLWLLLFLPAFMLTMFGYAVTFDVDHIPLGVYDQDRSRSSRELISYLTGSEYFDLHQVYAGGKEADRALDNGEVRVVMVIPAGLEQTIQQGGSNPVQFLVDGENAQSAATVSGYVNAVMQNFSLKTLAETMVRNGRRLTAPVEVQPRIWYNPELKSAKFLIPGLIGFIMMVTAVVSTSLSVVRERERGTMEQIMVSPLKPVELIIGKTIPYMFIALFSTLIIILAGYFIFGVEIKGSLGLLFLVTLVFLVGCLAFGLVISTIADTQQVAFMIALISTMLPTFVLSGFVFPISNMPLAIQLVTYLVPARYFLVALRSIILKGAGLAAFWDQLVMLGAYAVLMIVVSSVRMKKKRL